jgi:hypothetical protein
MDPLGVVLDREPIHIVFAVFRTGDLREPEVRHALADQRKSATARLGEQRKQLGRIGGDGYLFPADTGTMIRSGRKPPPGAIRSDRRMILLPSGQSIR